MIWLRKGAQEATFTRLSAAGVFDLPDVGAAQQRRQRDAGPYSQTRT
jgi:hypothetical protein